MEEMLIEKVRQRTFLYDTKSLDYRDQLVGANTWEGIGKELKIKRKFYLSSRDVSIVCPRPYTVTHTHTHTRARARGQESVGNFGLIIDEETEIPCR